MCKKVLIIDDRPIDFYKIKEWIGTIGFKKDDVIPVDDDITLMEEASGSNPDIRKFVEQQIRQNYKDIVLILCDCHFMGDDDRGYQIVKHIREGIKNLTPSNWASMVPIIGMTSQVNAQKLRELYNAGADYAFEKKAVIDTNEENGDNQKTEESENNQRAKKSKTIKKTRESETIKKIITTQVDKFERNLNSIYPSKYKEEIINAKKEHKNDKTAFIISSFRYDDCIKKVEKVLRIHGITPLVANIKGGRYTKPLWEDIVIHTHVCDFGIAIFADDSIFNKRDDKKRDKMNPNVNIEVGLMLGLQKDVLIFKHNNIPQMPSDFGGEQFISFSDVSTLEKELNQRLKIMGFNKKPRKKKTDTTS